VLSRLLLFLILGGAIALAVLNGKAILNYGEGQLIAAAAKNAIESENWEKAIEIYENGLREHPNSSNVAVRLGELYLQANQPEKAKKIFQDLLQREPNLLAARMGLASVYAASPEHINDAIIELRKALKEHPESPQLLSQIGNIYKAAAENPQETRKEMRKWLYDQARYYYQHALRLNPGQFQTQFNLGVAYQKQENLQPAAKAYCQAILINPSSYEARYNLGLVLSELNYLDEAFRQMGQAVQLSSEQAGEEVAMQIAKRVQNVKNGIYYNTEKQGLSSNGIPEFLDAKCLVNPQAEPQE
jgi:tetratricopeptide (TPR) repeat protein